VPCFGCGARQADPARGPSPWRRGVVEGSQVLLCPRCQVSGGWDERLDACPSCGSLRLSKALGSVRCSACGAVHQPSPPAEEGEAATVDGDVPTPDEIGAAVSRVLGQNGGTYPREDRGA